MSETKNKKWHKSNHKWVYLKVAFIYFTTPKRVYEIAHKSHSVSMREKLIRGRLIEYGVLSKESSNSKYEIPDLENSHL